MCLFFLFFRQWQSVTHNFGSCKKLLWDSWLKTIRPLLRWHSAGCVLDVTAILLLPNCERAVSEGSPASFSSGRQQMCRPSCDAWIFPHDFPAAHRCTSSAWKIVFFFFPLRTPSAPPLSSMSSPWFDFWCLDKCPLIPPVSLSSVDHLCAGCSPHTDGHRHGGQAAAARHCEVRMWPSKGFSLFRRPSNIKAFIRGEKTSPDIYLPRIQMHWPLMWRDGVG